MKKLEMNQMEVLHGAGPSGPQVICTGMGIVMGFIVPVAGAAVSICCLWVK